MMVVSRRVRLEKADEVDAEFVDRLWQAWESASAMKTAKPRRGNFVVPVRLGCR